jgi:hypothetical protein
MAGIFQRSTPHDISNVRALPGVLPLKREDWLHVDDAFADQMALRDALLKTRRDDVLAQSPGAQEAVDELLSFTLSWLAEHGAGYEVSDTKVKRPDGVEIAVEPEDALITLGRLVQEDLCILQRRGDEHVLIAAVVCFPASWTLGQKIGRPLVTIHEPVDSYDDQIARRVQRLFDGVQPDRPLWRFNRLNYADFDLFQPTRRAQPRGAEDTAAFPYLRTERQCILRLPKTSACVFSIHTYVMDGT